MWDCLDWGHRGSWDFSGAVKVKGTALSSSQWDKPWAFLAAGVFWLLGSVSQQFTLMLLDAIPKGNTLILNKAKKGFLLFPLFGGAVLSVCHPTFILSLAGTCPHTTPGAAAHTQLSCAAVVWV